MNRDRGDWNWDWADSAAVPPIDLSETAEAVQVRMDVAGVPAHAIAVEVSGSTLRISSQFEEAKDENGRFFHRLERRRTSFARAIPLPCQVKEDLASAECLDGVLTITFPKTDSPKSRRIDVRAR